MKKTPLILRSSIVALSAATLFIPSPCAALNDTFDPGGPLATITNFGGSLAVIQPDPLIPDPINNVLHLLNGEGSQGNHYTYDLTDPGAFETINASFDFRITNGSAGLADGFGFILIPTSAFGVSGDGPNPTAEEPNALGAFGVGIDVYPGINNISAHWNNFQVNELNAQFATSFRDNGLFNQLQITLQRIGNGTNATISILSDSRNQPPGTPGFKVMETVIPNMLPYENRVHFGGRTGGENMNLDLDNVKVAYTNPFLGGLPTAPTGHLFQDFSSAGTTSYRAVQAAASELAVFRPGPLIKAADAGSNGNFLRIVNDNVAGQNNRVVFDRAPDAGSTNMGEMLQFDLRFNSTDQPADGMGLLFLRTRDPQSGAANFDGDGLPSSEEPNHPNMLGIGIDVFDNDGAGTGDIAPGLSLHWNGAKIADVALPPELGLNQFHRLQVLREPAVSGINSGLNVTVIATPNINGVPGTPVTLINHQFVPNATNYDYRVQISGRTGGSNGDHDIDNIITSQIARPLLAHTQADFTEATGSGWKGYAFGTGAAPDIRNDLDLNGSYLRITHDTVNDQRNSVAFDKQLDGTLGAVPNNRIVADMSFRMRSPTDQPADGMSLILLPTSVYGNTGPGVGGTIVAEEPNVTGTFALAFDIYNGGGVLFNEASLHWNGLTVAESDPFTQPNGNVDPLLIDLDSGVFHHLHLELTQTALGTLVDLILQSDIFGLPGPEVVVYNDFLIADMTLYDYRAEVAARTGGLNMSVDIDDLLIQTIPEPGSATLLGLGGLLLARRRRRA